jgi:hypothetical protein
MLYLKLLYKYYNVCYFLKNIILYIVILNQKIYYLNVKIKRELKLLMWVVDAIRLNKNILIFKVGIIEHLKLFLEYIIPVLLISGH